MLYFSLGVSLYSTISDGKTLYRDCLRFKEKKIEKFPYLFFSLKTLSLLGKVSTVFLFFIKLYQTGREDPQKKNLLKISYALILTNSIILISEILAVWPKWNLILRTHRFALFSILENIEEILNSTHLLTKIAFIFIHRQAIAQVLNLETADQSDKNAAKIPFSLSDLKDVELDIHYENIPVDAQASEKFRCALTSNPLRYPVIILNKNLSAPLKVPIELFERKVILKNLKNPSTSVYPNTQEPIDLYQVKEHMLIRKRIERQ